MLKIEYAQSNFQSLIESGSFYQDRTDFIEKLENWNNKYPVFLRPRRFGKSLFIMMLHNYYGLEYADIFQSLFGHLYIGQHPTKEANSYMVLSLDFSRIDTRTHESTYQGFLDNVIDGIRPFIGAYSSFFTDEEGRYILAQQSPEAMIKMLFNTVKAKNIPHKIYLLIDEYDHFTNELLSFDYDRFKADVTTNGFVRKFYESLKMAARNGVIGRIFMTGVSPVTLDSLTSGFNIGDNITVNPIFHDMMGFRHHEVEAVLHGVNMPIERIPKMMSDLAAWYDGYRFHNTVTEPLFNPDMVLYFLKEYGIMSKYPDVMLDPNVASDYRKIKNIFKIGGEEAEKFELLEILVQQGYIDFPLTRLYNLEIGFTDNDFLSLLFYMGMLSFKELSEVGWRCEVPNYVIKKLYFEYFISINLAKTRLARKQRVIEDTIKSLVGKGNPEPFFKIVEEVLCENHSNRDEMVYGEKHLQTLMIGLLFPYESYFIHSEFEARRGYPDIFLERLPNKPLKFDIVLELKYVKKSAKNTVDDVVSQAQTQLNRYKTSARFNRPDVRGYYVVFLGGEIYKWEEW